MNKDLKWGLFEVLEWRKGNESRISDHAKKSGSFGWNKFVLMLRTKEHTFLSTLLQKVVRWPCK